MKIDELAKEFVARKSWPTSKYTRNQNEWLDGQRVLSFSAAFLNADEGLHIIATFDEGRTHRVHGPFDGVEAADALLGKLAMAMADSVDAATEAAARELDKFSWPEWPEVGGYAERVDLGRPGE